MKPGDIVWVFDPREQKIKKERVYEARGNSVFAGEFPDHIYLYGLGFDCFSTREALCEHYRKIFE